MQQTDPDQCRFDQCIVCLSPILFTSINIYIVQKIVLLLYFKAVVSQKIYKHFNKTYFHAIRKQKPLCIRRRKEEEKKLCLKLIQYYTTIVPYIYNTLHMYNTILIYSLVWEPSGASPGIQGKGWDRGHLDRKCQIWMCTATVLYTWRLGDWNKLAGKISNVYLTDPV